MSPRNSSAGCGGWSSTCLTRRRRQETLRDYVEDNLQSLTEWQQLLELREERDQAEAIGAARSTVTPEGDRRHRYVATATRLSNGAYRLLFQMQHEGRKYGEGDLEGLEPMYGAAATAAPEPGPVAATTRNPGGRRRRRRPRGGAAEAGEWGKNEAKATQVAGGVDGKPHISGRHRDSRRPRPGPATIGSWRLSRRAAASSPIREDTTILSDGRTVVTLLLLRLL